MSIYLMSDKPVDEWASFLMETVQMLEKRNVRGVAVVALLRQETEKDDQALIGYHNMELEDKEEAISLMKRDVIKKIVKENLKEWLKEMEGDD